MKEHVRIQNANSKYWLRQELRKIAPPSGLKHKRKREERELFDDETLKAIAHTNAPMPKKLSEREDYQNADPAKRRAMRACRERQRLEALRYIYNPEDAPEEIVNQ